MAVPEDFKLLSGGDCGAGDCPTVSTDGSGRIAVQGYKVDVEAPDGEAVVEIPEHVLREAVGALGR